MTVSIDIDVRPHVFERAGETVIARPVPAPAPPARQILEHACAHDRPFVLQSGPGDPRLSRWSYAGLEAVGSHDELGTAPLAQRPRGGPERPLADLPPFTGGLVGYVGYDATWAYAARPRRPRADPLGLPSQRFHEYDAIYARDEATGRGWILHSDNPRAANGGQRLASALLRPGRPLSGGLASNLSPRVSQSRHERRVREALGLIEAGELYQVNLTYALQARFRGHPGAALTRLGAGAPPFSAYLGLEADAHIVSASPECFVDLTSDGRVTTYPIKGTRRRGHDGAEDGTQAAALEADPKEQAEHMMIVDLLRNDLGRVSQPGSVRVLDLAYVESFPTVHHLTSAVEGRLAPEIAAAHLFTKLLPGGSITGAPKQAAMEVIDALEDQARGLYTGTVMWIDRGGASRSSIAIRTAQVREGELRFGVGGGIVHDSDPTREWEETRLKAKALGRALAG